MVPNEETPIAVEAKRSIRTLDPHIAHRQSAVPGDVVGKSVAIEKTAWTALKVEENEAGIFAGNDRIKFGKRRKDPSDVAEEIAEDVDQMNCSLVHEKAFHGLEIRLAIEIGVITLAVARTQTESDLIGIADLLIVQQTLELAVPGLEAEVLMNDQLDAGFPRY